MAQGSACQQKVLEGPNKGNGLLILTLGWFFLLILAAHGDKQCALHLVALTHPASFPGTQAGSFLLSLTSTAGGSLPASLSLCTQQTFPPSNWPQPPLQRALSPSIWGLKGRFFQVYSFLEYSASALEVKTTSHICQSSIP